ncbi:hypothetical protein A4L_14 [Anabaena phage A-4L]|uniref:Uncharacterized protein n=1 Tax=Anabaena phage A-4L TaxID=1357732 RepID=A0A059PY39_9CAUD|nr:hypothetical protein A4L_14 [Anabaena phage A-4L]AGR48541.1 hypothetical protein A4L_14 [Anabaena phage A-4L]
MNLTPYNNDGLELHIDNTTGEVFTSIRAAARMCNRNESVIRRFVTAAFGGLKTAEVLTTTGLKTAALMTEDQLLEVITEYKPTLLAKFARLGLRVALHQMAGYQVTTTAVEKPAVPQTYKEALMAIIAAEEEKERLALENTELMDDVQRLSEVVDELFDYSSILRIAKFNGVNENVFEWRKLKAVSEALGIEIRKVPCPRYVTKNLYHHRVWLAVYPHYKLPETTSIVVN